MRYHIRHISALMHQHVDIMILAGSWSRSAISGLFVFPRKARHTSVSLRKVCHLQSGLETCGSNAGSQTSRHVTVMLAVKPRDMWQ